MNETCAKNMPHWVWTKDHANMCCNLLNSIN